MNQYQPSPRRLGLPLLSAMAGFVLLAVPRSASAALPLVFEKNVGQAPPQAKFLARAGAYNIYFGTSDVLFELSRPAGPMSPPRSSFKGERLVPVTHLRMAFEGANPDTEVVGGQELPGKTNYLIGPESQWRTNIPQFGRVEYKGLYRGIDAAFYEGPGLVKYDFIVSAGADPRAIRLALEGARDIHVSAEGELVFETEAGEVRQKAPVAYQEVQGERWHVDVAYVMQGRRRVSFKVGDYDRQIPLVIDPVVYASYLGAEGVDDIVKVALDPQRNIYLAGFSTSVTGLFSRPTTGIVGYVAKLDPTGSILRYLTFVEGAASVAVDPAGHAYVVGTTSSPDLPGAPPGSFGGIFDAFVIKLTVDGSGFVYARYVGRSASDLGHGIAVDAEGNAYVVGDTRSKDWPINPDVPVFEPNPGGPGFDDDGFVAKLDPSGTLVLFSYLGGNAGDTAHDIALDKVGNLYVTGLTYSAGGFPVPQVPNSAQPTHTDGGETRDAYVVKITADWSRLVYLTYVGGPALAQDYNPADEFPTSIAVDGNGAAYVGGWTTSASLPPARHPAFQPLHAAITYGDQDGFVVGVNAGGTAYEFATFLGGEANEILYDLADQKTHGGPGPLQNGSFGQDAFVARFSPDGQTVYSSFFGGSGGESAHGVAVAENTTGGELTRTAYIVGGIAGTLPAYASPSGFQTSPS